jgi:hypothetical protein
MIHFFATAVPRGSASGDREVAVATAAPTSGLVQQMLVATQRGCILVDEQVVVATRAGDAAS